jgi:hypothetical protein
MPGIGGDITATQKKRVQATKYERRRGESEGVAVYEGTRTSRNYFFGRRLTSSSWQTWIMTLLGWFWLPPWPLDLRRREEISERSGVGARRLRLTSRRRQRLEGRGEVSEFSAEGNER